MACGRLGNMETKGRIVFAVIGVLALSAGSVQANAIASVVLTDQNSVTTVDVGSQAGQSSWLVDGVNQMSKQWFWYRIGNGPEASIDTISAPQVVLPSPNTLSVTYAN